ncbi:MAG: phosphotransferase [Dehalococcoidia bacterium]
MSSLAIPSTMDDITPAWLTAALQAGGRAKQCTVTGMQKVTIGQGVGILGELCRITPTYSAADPTAPATLIAKIPTADEGGKGVAQMLGFYEKEVRFYSDLCQSTGVRAAHSYYTAADPAAVKYVILMEDLGSLPIGDQVAGASEAECKTLVTEVAKLHARWWNSPKLAALDWIPEINAPAMKLSALAYAQALAPFLEKFAASLTPQQSQIAQDLLPRLNPIQDALANSPATLCHGDLRLDNVFWGSLDNASPVTLIDWQISGKGRGPYDIAYFMSQSVEPAVRAAIEKDLLREYHATLQENGVAGYSFDTCWDDYRLSVMMCLAYPVVAGGSIDLANERGLELATKMLTRSLSAIMDLKAYEVLDKFDPAPLPAIPGA